jgi:hypothetical protein
MMVVTDMRDASDVQTCTNAVQNLTEPHGQQPETVQASTRAAAALETIACSPGNDNENGRGVQLNKSHCLTAPAVAHLDAGEVGLAFVRTQNSAHNAANDDNDNGMQLNVPECACKPVERHNRSHAP